MLGFVSFPTFLGTGNFSRDAFILASDLNRFGISLHNFRIPLRRSIQNVMIPSIQKTFSLQGRPRWESLAESTVEARGSLGPILRRTNRLFSQASSFGIWRIDVLSAQITTLDQKVPYAKYHQAGTRNMPQRVFIEIFNEDEEAIENIFLLWVIERSATIGRFR